MEKIKKLCADKVALLLVLQNIKTTQRTRHELETIVNKIDEEIEMQQSREASLRIIDRMFAGVGL